jgi:hypothetical protein
VGLGETNKHYSLVVPNRGRERERRRRRVGVLVY